MSDVDTEQDKQPISSVNGQTIDNAPNKDSTEDQAPSTEGLKGTVGTENETAVSCESQAKEADKDGDEEKKDSQSPEVIANGESAKDHDNGEVSEKVEDSSVENKTEETQEEKSDNRQVNDEVVKTEKEAEKAAEESIPDEKSNDAAVTTADGEQSGLEGAVSVEVEKADKELKEEVQVDDKQTEQQSENQSSEERKDSLTADTEGAERKRAVTIDNPEDVKELTSKSGELPQKVQERSRTLGDIEGSASSSLKEEVEARSRTIWYTDEVEDTPSKPADSSTATEETVSYSTSIVGGVVHRVPINSSSPKHLHKPKEGSPQTSPSKKKSVIDTLFGRRKRSKSGSESPTGNTSDTEKGSQEKLPEPSAGTDTDAAKSDAEASESGPSAEVEDSKVTDADQEGKVAAETEKKDEESEIKPAAASQSEEGVKEETAVAAQASEKKEGETQAAQEVPVSVESAGEEGETSGEGTKGEQLDKTKDAVKRARSDHPGEEDTSPQPAAKKKKPIFGGIFTRRGSKKSKGEKTDKEKQGESAPAQTADDGQPAAVEGEESKAGTDQEVTPDTGDTTGTAQQEVTEDAISPAEGQAVESAKEEIADKEEQKEEATGEGEPRDSKEETVPPAEGQVESKEIDDTEDQEKTDEKPVEPEDSQPVKKHSFLGEFFGRRKSKKSKDAGETSQEKEEKVEGQETDQSAAPESSDPAAQKEVTEDAVSPAKEQAVESALEETAEKKEQEAETTTEGETSEKAEETKTPEDAHKSAEGSSETRDTDEKAETEEKEVQPQDSQPEKKHSIFSGFFGRRKSKKSKDADVSPAAETSQEKGEKEEQDGGTATQPADDAKPQAAEGVEIDQSAAPETSDTTAPAQQVVTEVVISPAVDQAVESTKEETVDVKVQEEEKAAEGEPSEVPEDAQKSADDTSEPKDAAEKQEAEEKPAQSQESQPEKKHSIFSGLFARRKSKKSKGEMIPAETSQEKEGEEQQGEGLSTQSSETTDQGASPDTSATTSTAQQQVAEEAISPAAEQAVESSPEILTDKENVDGEKQEPKTTGPEEVKTSAEEKGEVNDAPRIEEPTEDTSKESGVQPVVENGTSPESEEAQDKETALKERIALSQQGSHSPKTRRMQMRISYAESDGEGGREVEVIGTPERGPEAAKQAGDRRVSCRDLGEADHEGWLAKKGGPLFFSSWKRKWVVLKEGKLYYFKTAFDPEASGIINIEGLTVAQAPETKKNFCFKCEQPGPKPQVSIFMADSKEDMDKWLAVLGAASRGEVVHKIKQHHLAPRDEVVMRKKSGSNSAQRTSSVLAVGGRHDFLEDEEDLKAIRRRSTPGSLSKPQDYHTPDTHPVIIETITVPSDTQQVTEPAQDSQKETEKSGEGEATESPIVVVDEVVESSAQVVVETVPIVEVTPEQETPAEEAPDDTVPVVASQEKEEESEAPANVTVEDTPEVESAPPVQEPATDASDSTVDKTDGGAVSVVTTESSVTVVETVKTTSVVSEKVETVVSVVKTEVTEVSSTEQPPEESKQDVKEDDKEVSQTQSDASDPLPNEPASPSKTKWYFTLDQQETWSVPPEVEAEKVKSRQKTPSTSSDKGSIKSDRGSIKSDKSASEDDLMIMCRNIREARLSIVGDHMWEGAERLRALSTVHDDNEEAIVKLKTLERTLKDKEKHLEELEELLAQPEINRDSIYAWKLRYSDLVEEMFPQDAEGAEEKSAENAPEGGEGETQDQKQSEGEKDDEKLKSSETEESEKDVKEQASEEVKDEASEDVEKKSDEELASSSKVEGEEKVDDKQEAPEISLKETHEQDQEIVKEEQPSCENQEETKEDENDNLTVIVQVDQSPVESAAVADSEQSVQETETTQKQEVSVESSSEQKPCDSQGESGEREDSEGAVDTHL